MKVILAILFSALLARAEIPLELIAEFELPPGTGAWDVQHWMDDSTFGWVAAVGREEIQYETRLGGGVETVSFGDTLCNETYDDNFEFDVVRAVAIVKGAVDSARFAVEGEISNGFWMETYPVIVIWDGNNERCRGSLVPSCDFLPGNWRSLGLYSWPPPPAVSTHLVSAIEWDYFCDGTGADPHEFGGRAQVMDLDSLRSVYIRPAKGVKHFFGLDFEFGSVGQKRLTIYDDTPPYDHDILINLRTIATLGPDGLDMDTLCYERFDVDPDSEFMSTCEWTSTTLCAVDRYGNKKIVAGGNCFDGDSHELLWGIDGFEANHVVCRGAAEGQVLLRQFGNRFTIHALEDGRIIDESQDVIGDVVRVLDTGECPNEIISEQREGSITTIRVYKLLPYETQLVISIAPLGDQILLSWNSLPSASHFQVCRNLEYSGDLCSDGEVYVTTDTTMVLTPWAGAAQEFYCVEPVFE